jgi:hypothetical protein
MVDQHGPEYTMCSEKLIISPREVYREIKKGDEELTKWIKNYEEIFLEPIEQEVEFLQLIYSKHPPEVISKYAYGLWADPLVIACAKHFKLTIVQEEQNQKSPFIIPRIAKIFDLKYIRLSDFFEEQGWVFH